ncbi:MAG TPA: hypothetical protein VF351_00215 [Actinomycetota bacterium]
MISKIARIVLAAVMTMTLAGAAPASAKDGDVIRQGACSGSADWKLKLSLENGRIEVEYEVDSNVVGQTWRVRIVKNGTTIFQGTRQTKAPSGSFEVRLVTSNPPGSDTFRARAVNVATGQTCLGSATI